MERKRKRRAAAELAVVILVTLAAFAWGRRAALAKRGYSAFGGEYLLLLLPVLYYVGKSMRIKKQRPEDRRRPSP